MATPAQEVMEFKDIRITGFDPDKTEQSPTASGLRLMYLSLSQNPPGDWIQLFERERSFARHAMWREARIRNGYIVVDCVPEEMERFHLDDLKLDVASANYKYSELLIKRQAAEGRAEEAKRIESERLRGIAKRLNFD